MDPLIEEYAHIAIKVLSYFVAFLISCQIMDALFDVNLLDGISILLKALWKKIKPKEEPQKDVEERTFDDFMKEMDMSDYNPTERSDEIFETYLKSMGLKIVPKDEPIDVEWREVE